MPELIVTARELRYGGKSLVRGARFQASEKDAKVLKLVRKAEDAPSPKPLRKVAETKPAPKFEVAPEPAVEAAAPEQTVEPEPAATARVMTTDDLPEATQGRYRNRALKSED